MINIEDPLLALIIRFVVEDDQLDCVSNEFIQRQIKTLEDYLTKFPIDEHERHTMHWVQQHAAEYRKQWEKKVVTHRVSKWQCKDCPLLHEADANHCIIHQHWLSLLQEFSRDDISTAKYVESALKLLTEHKEHLSLNQQLKLKLGLIK